MAYVTAAKRFMDSVVTMIERGSWHAFRVINLSPDTHPFHIHLTQFQLLRRRYLDTGVAQGVSNEETEFNFVAVSPEDPGTIDANEAGWKDTFRVNPGERGADDAIITAEDVLIAGCFDRHAGRYMFHCHILKHEDADMMRPIVVMPQALMRLMPHRHHADMPGMGD